MISVHKNLTILPSALLFLLLCGEAMAAPEDCRDGFLRQHAVNILNGTLSEPGAFPDDDDWYMRDPREGCLVWLRIENGYQLARITESDFGNWRTCEIKLRWENPEQSKPEMQPLLSQFLAIGTPELAQVFLEHIELQKCSLLAVMMANGSMGLVLPPRQSTGESFWANASATVQVPQTIDLPGSGKELASLSRIAFAENGISPMLIGPSGGVFSISGQFFAYFADSGSIDLVRREVCPPTKSALGVPVLTAEEILQLTGGDITDQETFFRQLVSLPNTPLDIRAVALNC